MARDERSGPTEPGRSDDGVRRYDVFLSHNGADKAEVAAIARRLRDKHGLWPFFDEWSLVPGERWMGALEQALEQSEAIVVFVGAEGMSAWHEEERQLAIAEAARRPGRRVIPVLLPRGRPTKVPGFLKLRTWVELDKPHGFEKLLAGIRGRALEDGRGFAAASPPSAPAPDSREGRLEAAYQLREELAIAGKDTSQVDAEILELRRQQRHGPSLNPGEFLDDGRFRLIEIVGTGGFATVWKAYDRRLRSLVAVKVLHGVFARESSQRERLFRGAQKMAELRHPNVVRVLEGERQDHGFHYYVMEYIAGGNLYQAVLDNKLDIEERLDIIDTIASTLEATHREGLVHRDIKPQNILLHQDGSAVLSDFDLVHAMDTTGGTRTGPLGTVLYAAPEQNRDASRVDHRADVFSLGMTAVFCLHGAPLPFDAMYERGDFLDGLQCSKRLREALGHAVAVDPQKRLGSMEIFRAELDAARHARPRVDMGGTRIEAPRGGVELVFVPGGSFMMGVSPNDDEGHRDGTPTHLVTLDEFFLAPAPITNAQYRRFMRDSLRPNSVGEPEFWREQGYNLDDQPVVGVTWEDAREYCRWAGLRLPTEAQWEYACRAGTTTKYHTGDTEADLARAGWYRGNSNGTLQEVRKLEPNAFGLYDMHGNISEWCEDAWIRNYDDVVHRPGDGLRERTYSEIYKVFRGGYFNGDARYATSTYRFWFDPAPRRFGLGFRPVLNHR